MVVVVVVAVVAATTTTTAVAVVVTLPPVWERSFVMTVSVCLSVCLSVQSAGTYPELHVRSLPSFYAYYLWLWLSLFCGIVIHYAVPVL